MNENSEATEVVVKYLGAFENEQTFGFYFYPTNNVVEDMKIIFNIILKRTVDIEKITSLEIKEIEI